MKWFSIFFLFYLCFDTGFCWKPYTVQKHLKESASDSIEYFTEPTIKIVIHIDSVLAKNLAIQYGPKSRRKIKIVTEKLIKEVEKIFRHPSLNQKVQLVLLDTKFLKNNSNIITMSENATMYLKSYCEWQGRKKTDNIRFYSILMTGLDIYVKGPEEGRSSTGRGYMGGVCSVKKSCALLEWQPRNIAYLLAHEIAHSLGVPHDGTPFNLCAAQGHVMTARYNPRAHPTAWSACSRWAMKRYLASERTWCLRNDYDVSSD